MNRPDERAVETASAPDVAARFRLAVDVAVEAGRLSRSLRRAGVRLHHTKSGPADIVTEADLAVEALIRDRILRAFPADGFLGEEGSGWSSGGGADDTFTWVVDPIDGTVNYARGIPAYAVSIAVVRGGADPTVWEALVGVVYNPVTDELFSGARGCGAWCNGVPMQVAGDFGAPGALVATGFNYDRDTHGAAMRRIEAVLPFARDIRRAGSAALDLAFVAAGRIDGFFEKGLPPWDHAAGALLVSESGGVVSGLTGPPDSTMVIAASSQLHLLLIRVLPAFS